MDKFQPFGQPWWINLFIFVPFATFYFWRKGGLKLTKSVLTIAAIFGIAFGFVEASVVVYLRAAVGLLAGHGGTSTDVSRLSTDIYQQAHILGELPKDLVAVETFREIATIVILFSIALLAVKSRRERWAIFLWTFAIWDITYYAGLWAMVGWPPSLSSPDVLFLIPVPWLSQVWFPVFVNALIIAAVIASRKPAKAL